MRAYVNRGHMSTRFSKITVMHSVSSVTDLMKVTSTTTGNG